MSRFSSIVHGITHPPAPRAVIAAAKTAVTRPPGIGDIRKVTIKQVIKESSARVLPPSLQHKVVRFVDHAADKYGERKACANKESLKLGALGLSAGTAVYPGIGSAVGAVVGVVAGQAKGLSSPCNAVTVIGDNPQPQAIQESGATPSYTGSATTDTTRVPSGRHSWFDELLDEVAHLFGKKVA